MMRRQKDIEPRPRPNIHKQVRVTYDGREKAAIIRFHIAEQGKLCIFPGAYHWESEPGSHHVCFLPVGGLHQLLGEECHTLPVDTSGGGPAHEPESAEKRRANPGRQTPQPSSEHSLHKVST